MAATEKSNIKILLVDLPVYPKGVLSLSLPLLAGYLKRHFDVSVFDFNFYDWNPSLIISRLTEVTHVGIKTSSQNFAFAQELTTTIKKASPSIKIIWGGELPSLLPDECLKYADSIVTKRIESCLGEFIEDIKGNTLKRRYDGSNDFEKTDIVPLFNAMPELNSYYNFMGYPLEVSGGCDKACRFCMVHVMQTDKGYKIADAIRDELKNIGRNFINVVDYNIGMNKEELLKICSLINESEALGWMGEMTLQSLDDDEVLAALRDSRCRMIYCGLESVDEESLKSVKKHKTNTPSEYRRIIKKAQSYGVNIASGFIVGLDGTSKKTFSETLDFFISSGIIYVKLTFLTYNPGTYFHKRMIETDKAFTLQTEKYDGNHLTYLYEGIPHEELYLETEKFIRKFYSLSSVIRRSIVAESTFSRRLEFILFNYCYSSVYFEWIQFRILNNKISKFGTLLRRKFSKPFAMRIADSIIHQIRIKTA